MFTADAAAVARFAGTKVPARALPGLRTRGWVFDDDRYVGVISRPSPAGCSAVLTIDPALALADPEVDGTHRLDEISLADGLDPVAVSEILADLTALTGS